jgi:hypothetical protein
MVDRKKGPRKKPDLTSEEISSITEWVRQKNELNRRPPDPITGQRPLMDLDKVLAYTQETGFRWIKEEIEKTAAYYAEVTSPQRYIGYPPSPDDPAPIYESWRDFLCKTPWPLLRRFCLDRARQANRPKFHREGPGKGTVRSSNAEHRVEGYQVWRVMASAKGRCVHCGSLAVERQPPDGRWGRIGRRVGSLEHLVPLSRGGDNDSINLAWSCLWCNHLDRERERRKGLTARGALDSGGFHPSLGLEPNVAESQIILATKLNSIGIHWTSDVEMFAPKKAPPQFSDDDDVSDFELLPDHEYPEDTAMLRDTFGGAG